MRCGRRVAGVCVKSSPLTSYPLLNIFRLGYMDATKFLRDGPRMLEEGRLMRDARTGDLHPGLKARFQEEFEKMIVLDYIIRNTDRGLDNWMVGVSEQCTRVSRMLRLVSRNTMVP